MGINWTKEWSASDDGTIFSGSDLQNIQSDIDGGCVLLAGTQTITGDKIFSGTVTIGSNIIPDVDEYVFYEGSLISWENNAVFYDE